MNNNSSQYREKVSQLVSWGHWFCFFNIVAAMLLGTRFVLLAGMPDSNLGLAYLLTSWIGHFSFLSFILYLLLIFPATFVIPSQRLLRLFGVLVATLGQTTLLLDTHAFETLGLHISPLVWDLLVSGERSELNARWQYIFVSVPLIFLLQMVLSEVLWRKLRKLTRRNIGQRIGIVLGLCFFSSHLIYAWGDANLDSQITAQRSTFPLSYPMTAKSFMERHGLLDRKEFDARLDAMGIESATPMQYPLAPLKSTRPENQPNVLIIVVDSLRGDMYNDTNMPFVSQLNAGWHSYNQHFSSGNDNNHATLGLFYGLPSTYYNSIRAAQTPSPLLAMADKHDYKIRLFSGNDFAADAYSQLPLNDNTDSGSTSDPEAVAAFAKWVAKQDSPWLSYIELTDVAQYADDSAIDGPFTLSPDEGLRGALRVSYQNAVHRADAQVNEIITALAEQLPRTLIILTSNHGIEFNETGNWGAGTNFSQYQIQVPLLVHLPQADAFEPDVIETESAPADEQTETTSEEADKVELTLVENAPSDSSDSNENSSETQTTVDEEQAAAQMPEAKTLAPLVKVDTLSSHLDILPSLLTHVFGVTNPSSDYSSGVATDPLAVSKTRRWVLSGNSEDIVMVEPQSTTVINPEGNYRIYDENYHRNDDAKPKLSYLIDVMKETRRFYQEE
uniref:DUF3413 domain-containing protein n=1 Tax=Thaumasiovibrio occultus TaxID=1891184 RepID=UPI000B361A17|nr:DUF3413 domain-containing protein [Thaumasiovibrio occultus]